MDWSKFESVNTVDKIVPILQVLWKAFTPLLNDIVSKAQRTNGHPNWLSAWDT